MQVQKITTCLWFQTQAAEAAKFYVSLFDDAKVVSESPVVTMFQLAGQQFMALNGNREPSFTDAVSLMVTCKDSARWTRCGTRCWRRAARRRCVGG